MNPRLKKEFRELFPAFCATVVLIAVPFAVGGEQVEVFPFVALALGSVAMGGLTFGSEFHHRTFSSLLSQPVPRSLIWKEKMIALGTALLLTSAMALVLNFGKDPKDAFAMLAAPLLVFSAAPLLTLFARNGIAGGVFAIALPGLLIAAVAAVAPYFPPESKVPEVLGTVLLLAYCVASYALGFRLFLRIEVIEGLGRDLRLPVQLEQLTVLPKSTGPTSPFLALLRKELRLQQMSLLLAATFVAVAVMAFLLYLLRPDRAGLAGGLIAAAFTIYVVIFPLLAGAMAFAEERTWGLSEWQLSLPPSGSAQWGIKAGLLLTLNLILGLLLPAALFAVGRWFLASRLPGGPDIVSPELFLAVIIQLLVVAIAAYAGTFSANTLKAMLVALGIVVAGILVSKLVFLCVTGAQFIQGSGFVALWFLAGSLLFLVCLFFWFSHRNFQNQQAPTKALVLQTGSAFAVLVLLLVNFRLLFS